MSGGFAVGYVFLYLMPKLSYYASHQALQVNGYPYLGSTFVFMAMMLGFASYWIIDLRASVKGSTVVNAKLHAVGFMFYNVLVGYVITRTVSSTILALPLATAAMAFHLAGMNHLIKHWSEQIFHGHLRWAFALAIIVGGAIGVTVNLASWAVAVLTAFIGGAILINVVYYELPRRDMQSVRPFMAGVGMFTVVCFLIRYFNFIASCGWRIDNLSTISMC